MKQCPHCRRTYTDESLNYCLDDGAELIYGPGEDERATAVFPSEKYPSGPQISEHRDPKKRRVTVASICMLALFAAFAAYWFYPGPSRKQIDSIAVLPFQNLSGNTDAEYLSDGIAESLINNLSDLQQLKVTARSTAFRYKGKELNPQVIGRELGISALLTGTIRQIGDRLDVQVDLIDTSNGVQLWGKEYEGRLADVISVKQSIAREVVEKLKIRLTGDQKKQITKTETTDPEAFKLYLKGRYFWGRRSPGSIRKAIDSFEDAIRKDPNFALAFAGLADAYVVPANRVPPSEAMPKAKAAAMRAIEIDDNLAEAHTSLGRVLQVYDWNWSAAEKEFKRALDLNPRYAVAHQWYGGFLERTGRLDEGIAERKQALELDPLSTIASFELGQAYYFARDYDQAAAQLQKTLDLDPDFPAAVQYMPLVYVQKGMFELAIAKLKEAPESAELDSTGMPGYIYSVVGRKQEARAMVSKLIGLRDQQYISPVAIAIVYAGLGEEGNAIEWLEKGYQEHAFQMQFLKLDPRWDNLRNDPRFVDLARRIGLPQ